MIFLVIAVPWHLIAEHRSPGFLWSYIINEHFKRALGTRYPPDYDSVPLGFWWAPHLVWFAPWSVFLPFAIARISCSAHMGPEYGARGAGATTAVHLGRRDFGFLLDRERIAHGVLRFRRVACLAMLLGLGLARAEEAASRWLHWLQGVLAVIGLIVAAVLGYFVWASLRIPSDCRHLAASRNPTRVTLPALDGALSRSHTCGIRRSALAGRHRRGSCVIRIWRRVGVRGCGREHLRREHHSRAIDGGIFLLREFGLRRFRNKALLARTG